MEVDQKETPDQPQEIVVPPELLEGAVDVSTSQDGGVRKVILREGTGDETPGHGDEVTVHYTGMLVNGSKFDSSRDRDDKFKFQLGQGRVIKAWDQGVATMKRGELCRLICRSDYAYGKNGSPPNIPPEATLIFEVELFDWKGEDLTEDQSGGIIRKVITDGPGFTKPNEGAQVEVELKGLHEGRVFDERTVSFCVGDAADHNLPNGIDVAIRKFKKGETSVLTLSPEYAFGNAGSETYNIPGGATVKYEVSLKALEQCKEGWEMEPAEKLSQSELVKTKGTSLFKAAEFGRALKKYQQVTKWLEDGSDFSEEREKERTALMLAAHLNCALCYLKQEQWTDAKSSCGKALELDANSEKAFFRRGQANVGLREWEAAKEDFQAALKVDNQNKAARNQLTICEHKLKLEKERQKKLYANMFSKSLSLPSEQKTPEAPAEVSANGDGSAV